jgi:hypothetical protein
MLILLLCNSCIGEKKEVVDELLIFGYSGFCLVDSLNQAYPMSAWEYNDSVKFKYDSTRLDIRQYFEFEKDSLIKLTIRKPDRETEYYSINPSNNMGLVNLINSTFKDKKYASTYCFIGSHTGIYDGWYYSLYCKTSKGNTYLINYTPGCLPGELRTLHELVEDILYKNNLPVTNRFEYHPITTMEAKRLFKKYPPPLPIRTTKFTPPVIID